MRVTELPTPAQVESILAVVRHLETQVDRLKAQLAETQERLSNLEGRTVEEPHSSSSHPVGGSGASSASTQSGITQSGYQVGSVRESVARGIGQWIKSCLAGDLRGPSGRERVNLQSRVYLVVRDIQGQVHNPPLVFDSWRQCSEVVIREKQAGDSIYIGLPTKTEARIALTAAGLHISPALTERNGA